MKKKLLALAIVMAIIAALIVPMAVSASSTVNVYNLQPAWDAVGGGGVYSAYYAGPPNTNPAVSPGSTAIFDNRPAGIIKAGFGPYPGDITNWDQGLFGFIPNVTINAFAADPLTYVVENQTGANPVWMTIEIDTGVVGDRSDNTTYQFIPAAYGGGWSTVNAGAGEWQQQDDNGNGTGNFYTLSDLATTYSGLNVVRAYLRLGMGPSYHGNGNGTVAWVNTATVGGVTYDFEVANAGTLPITGTIVAPTISVSAPSAYTWTLWKVGDNYGSDVQGSVSVANLGSANNVNWQVVAQDLGADYGVMRTTGNVGLTNKFEISKDDSSFYNADTPGITYTGASLITTTPLDFYGYQKVTNTDAAGTYQMTITFTATITSYN
jgi:hypothetical protein